MKHHSNCIVKVMAFLLQLLVTKLF